MKILSPVAYSPTEAPVSAEAEARKRLTRAVILRNAWPAMGKIADVASTRLKDRYGFSAVTLESFPTSSAAPEETFDRVSKAGDFVIIGAAT